MIWRAWSDRRSFPPNSPGDSGKSARGDRSPTPLRSGWEAPHGRGYRPCVHGTSRERFGRGDPLSQARIIVIGNEKGGAGKSTIAVHLVTALLHAGARVAVVDLDIRQQSTGHFFANRRAWTQAEGVKLPEPDVRSGASAGMLEDAL